MGLQAQHRPGSRALPHRLPRLWLRMTLSANICQCVLCAGLWAECIALTGEFNKYFYSLLCSSLFPPKQNNIITPNVLVS